ncbi:lipopolysaccharide heptosyltransferase II [Candidatus Marithioploca araucensis]|uniref:lipopolysaccharide heptosyltransferase II n=1 Tax=Candidatus Marithioploca araucensis TaxID=70273 RepID=A0ABT7VT24_9GAMM|nr:lipopolysaccharide heptosyltransferase II [Candidatus Marithioploca araucensis]
MIQNSIPTAILVVGPSWVGDMVMAQTLFRVLKSEQPERCIDVLSPLWSEGLLKRMPEVRCIIPHTIEHGQLAWKKRQRIGFALRYHAYQQAIVLPNSWKSALIPFWANIPQRTGFIGEIRYGLLNDIRRLDKSILPRTVDRFVALGLPKHYPKMGNYIPHPRLLPGTIENVLQRFNLKARKPILALCPGAEYGPAKRWPIEYYVTCAKRKIAEGWTVWVFGSHKDIPLGAEIQVFVGKGCINLCGKTTLSEAVDLLSMTTAVITNDSGLMHVAAALDKCTIALFGSSSTEMTPPLSNYAHLLSLGLECSPCYQRFCPKKHLKCLRDIKPERVLEILNHFQLEQ